MSHYAVVECEITDEDALIDALEEIEPNWAGNILRSAEGEHLYGYHGDERPEIAHVIVRRKHVSPSSNDIGFVRGENGKFRAIVSDYDKSIGRGKSWLDRVTQVYAKNVVRKQAKVQGYSVVSETAREDGSIRLVLEI